MTHSWVEVDLDRVKQNLLAMRQTLPASVSVVLVVKANAYGHGIEAVALAATAAGIRWFAVAYLEEALRLRRILPDARIILLGVLDPADCRIAHEQAILPIIANTDHLFSLRHAAAREGICIEAHLKIDTGMGRLGIEWDEIEPLAEELRNPRQVRLSGVCSHFAAVDPDSPEAAREQVRKFNHALQFLPSGLFRHLSSSRAALFFPEWDFDGIRQGISAYGYGADHPAGRFRTQPVLQWKTKIIQIKQVPAGYRVGYVGTHVTENPTRIAVLSVGYADGYNRALSNRGDVLVRGQRCAVIGRVSMNWITVDLGPDLNAQVGDEVVLMGEQGGDAIWASELSRICRTIPYEILTGINATIERRYRGELAAKTD